MVSTLSVCPSSCFTSEHCCCLLAHLKSLNLFAEQPEIWPEALFLLCCHVFSSKFSIVDMVVLMLSRTLFNCYLKIHLDVYYPTPFWGCFPRTVGENKNEHYHHHVPNWKFPLEVFNCFHLLRGTSVWLVYLYILCCQSSSSVTLRSWPMLMFSLTLVLLSFCLPRAWLGINLLWP